MQMIEMAEPSKMSVTVGTLLHESELPVAHGDRLASAEDF